MIRPGDTIPSVPIKLVDADGVTDTTSDAVLSGGTVVFFGVPGAFTPTCDTSHLPGVVSNRGKLAALGVTRVGCGTVDDHDVVKAWGARGKVDFIAAAHARRAEALGLGKSFADLGTRYARFAMIVVDGTVKDLFVQDVAGVTVSGAPAVLLALEAKAYA